MTPLQSRKQLLLAESELNRAQMAADVSALTTKVRAFTGRTTSFVSVASSALALVTAFQGGKSAGGGGKRRSWLQIILKSAGLVSTIWLALRAHKRKQEGT
jgi:hypothetical protein